MKYKIYLSCLLATILSCNDSTETVNRNFNITLFLSEKFDDERLPNEVIQYLIPFKVEEIMFEPSIKVDKLFSSTLIERQESSDNEFIKSNFKTTVKKTKEKLEKISLAPEKSKIPKELTPVVYFDHIFSNEINYLAVTVGKTSNYKFIEEFTNVSVIENTTTTDSLNRSIATFINQNPTGQIIILHDINFLLPESEVSDIVTETDFLLQKLRAAESRKEDLKKFKDEITSKIEELLPYSDYPDAKKQIKKLKGEENSYVRKIENQDKLISIFQTEIAQLKRTIQKEREEHQEQVDSLGVQIETLETENENLIDSTKVLSDKVEEQRIKRIDREIQGFVFAAQKLTELVRLEPGEQSVQFYEIKNGVSKKVTRNQKRYEAYRIDHFEALCEHLKPAYKLARENNLDRQSLEEQLRKTYQAYQILVKNSKDTKDEKLPKSYAVFLERCGNN